MLLWYQWRSAMPRESSVEGFRKVLAAFHQLSAGDPAHQLLDADTLGQVFQQYTVFRREHEDYLHQAAVEGGKPAPKQTVQTATEESAATGARPRPVSATFSPRGPLDACPACHRTFRGAMWDCCMKLRRLAKAGVGEDTDYNTPGRLIYSGGLTPEHVAAVDRLRDHTRKGAQHNMSDCTTQFAANDKRAKRSKSYDVQGAGALVCRHGIIHQMVLLFAGERYSNLKAVLDWLWELHRAKKITLAELFTCFYDVGCFFGGYFIGTPRPSRPRTSNLPRASCTASHIHSPVSSATTACTALAPATTRAKAMSWHGAGSQGRTQSRSTCRPSTSATPSRTRMYSTGSSYLSLFSVQAPCVAGCVHM